MPTWPTSTHAPTRGHLAEAFGDVGEPVEPQPGGVLQEQHRAVRSPLQPGAEVGEPGDQVAGPLPHGRLVVDDQAGDPAAEPVRERLDRGPAPRLQQVDLAAEVHDRPVGPLGGEAEDPLELLGGVGVDLGGQPGLVEPEPGQLQQGVVAVDPALEQRPQGRDRVSRG